MLTLEVPMTDEFYDEGKKEFIDAVTFTLELEHSLASLSKWESREEKPFLGKEDKTTKETMSYVKDMTLTPDVPDEVFERLSDANLLAINDYINAKMTATWFSQTQPRRVSQEIITAELLYYMMVSLQIPFETQYWHLNRLTTLIQVINEKNKPSKKMPRQTARERQAQINAQRRAKHGTRG